MIEDPKFTFDRQTVDRFWNELKSMRDAQVGAKAMRLAAALFVLLLGVNFLNVISSYVGRDFMTAIEHRRMSGFVSLGILYILVFAASTGVAVIYRFCEESLGLLWREWLTRRIVDRYLEPPVYYLINEHWTEGGDVSNPDQRIAEDIKTFAVTTLSFVLMTLNASLTILAFAGILWTISPVLFGVALAYAGCGSFIAFKLGHTLIGLNFKQFDKEANFRADLLHVRNNAESIALLSREERMRRRLARGFDDLAENFRKIIAVNRNLGYFTTGYSYLIQIVPVLVVAPMFIRGDAEFGVITQSSLAFVQLMGAFSLIVTQFQSISSFSAVVARLGVLLEALEKARGGASGLVVDDNPDVIEFQELTVKAVCGTTLVESLSLRIPRGHRLLVTGTDQEAKVALLRAVAGISLRASGRITRPGAGKTLILPERPYLPPGTLRDALVGNGMETERDEDRLRDILDELGLVNIVERAGGFDTIQDWNSLLSMGEQQLLAVARLLLADPWFVFLDRATTALGSHDVNKMLTCLDRRGITYIALGHSRMGRREGDIQAERFDAVLELPGNGSWSLSQTSA